MASISDGIVIIDTRVDSSGAKRDLNNMSKSLAPILRKIGGLVATAFSVKALIDFSKQAVELASDLQEVQNVVDTSFKDMSYKMEEFADTAIEQFGISRLEAKRTGSTFMAMASGMGLAMNSASDMAISLTGLSADMASFYNVRQDVASTALKSIFTGETETLKQFGIVMTEVNLQEFAYQKGINKKIQAMTQAEKVQLRYDYVMQQTALAQGDFAKTSDSWANQTRILSERWKEFMTIMGNGLVKVLTPVIKALNNMLTTMINLGNKMAEVFGFDIKNSTQSATAGMTDVTVATEDYNEAQQDAIKTNDKALGSYDKLNVISKDSAGEVTSPMDSTATALSDNKLANELDKTNEKLTTMHKILEGVKTKANEVKGAFVEGFKIGIGGDWKDSLDTIYANVKSIKGSLSDIFTDQNLVKSVNNFAGTLAKSLGTIVGSLANIGLTIGQNITSGISKYLDENKDFIIDSLVSIFDNNARIAEAIGNLTKDIADIFSVFRGENATNITKDIVAIISNSALGIASLAFKLGADIVEGLTKPINDNKDKIKTALEGVLSPLSTITSTLSKSVTDTISTMNETYDNTLAPSIKKISDAISDVFGAMLDAFNKYVSPTLQSFADGFAKIWSDDVQSLINNVIGLVGDVGKKIGTIVKFLGELLSYLIDKFSPALKPILDTIGKAFNGAFKLAVNVVNGLVTALRGIVNLDVKQIAKGMKDTAKAIMNAFKGLGAWFKTNVVDKIKNVFKNIASWLKNKFLSALNGIKSVFTGIGNWFKTNVLNPIQNVFKGIGSWFTSKFTTAFNGIKSAFSNVKSVFSTIVSKVKAPFANIANWFKTTFTTAWTNVKNVFSKGGKVFSGITTGILDGLKSVINKLIDGINNVISVPFDGLNKALKSLKNTNIAGVKPFSKLPTIPVPNIPKLATGAVLPANKPFMAMVGDQKHGTNVEAPLETIKQALIEALQTSGQNEKVINVMLPNGRVLAQAVWDEENKNYKRTGKYRPSTI